MRKTISALFCLILMAAAANLLQAQATSAPTTVKAEALDNEVRSFLEKEVAAHLSDIKSYDPAPRESFQRGNDR